MINYSGGLKTEALIEKIQILDLDSEYKISGKVNKGSSIFIPSRKKFTKDIVLESSLENQTNITKYNFFDGIKISDIFYTLEMFNKNDNLLFASIERQTDIKKPIQFLGFSPYKVIKKEQDFKLYPRDIIKIYNNNEINSLIKENSIRGLNTSPDLLILNDPYLPQTSGSLEELLMSLIIEVNGKVDFPGKKPIAGRFNIKEIIELSGGYSRNADKDNILINEPYMENGLLSVNEKLLSSNMNKLENYFISPGTSIRINEKESQFDFSTVEISGQVLQPGNYRITNSTSIKDLIKKLVA